MIAWHLLSPPARMLFRHECEVDADTWKRGRGWALAQGLIALPYYANTNARMAAAARHVIREVIDDCA